MKQCLLKRYDESKQIPKKLPYGFSWNKQQETNLSLKWVGHRAGDGRAPGILGFFCLPWEDRIKHLAHLSKVSSFRSHTTSTEMCS